MTRSMSPLPNHTSSSHDASINALLRKEADFARRQSNSLQMALACGDTNVIRVISALSNTVSAARKVGPCVICTASLPNILYDCGHMIVCEGCHATHTHIQASKNMPLNCPACRAEVHSPKRVFS